MRTTSIIAVCLLQWLNGGITHARASGYDEQVTQAVGHFKAGAQARKAGLHAQATTEYEHALTLLRELEEIARTPAEIHRTRWNIGRCFEELGRYTKAVRAFGRSLEAASSDTALRTAAREKVVRLRARLAVGSLKVTCDSPNAVVELAGAPKDRRQSCGALFKRVPPGTYRLKASVGRAVVVDQPVELVAGRRVFLALELHGKLRITADVPNASVQIGQTALGSAPTNELNLLAGRYRVSIAAPGRARWTQVVEVQAGQTRTLSAKLDPEVIVEQGPPAWIPWALWGGSGAAIVAGTTFIVLGRNARADADDEPDAGRAADLRDTADTHASVGTGMLLTAALLAASGAAVWNALPETAPTVAAIPNGIAIGWRY